MCGRFANDKGLNELIEEYVAAGGDFREWAPSWNVAPTTTVPIVREHDGQRVIEGVRWGIVSPSSPTFGGGKPVINARMETVATNGLFKSGFASRRCIVPAAGYYEWQLQEGGKQPYFIHEPGRDIAMAGILRGWRDRSKPENDPEAWRTSMAIITRDAHVAPGEVHDRMPAFLTPDVFDLWLGGEDDTELLLHTLDHSSLQVAHDLEYFAVSKAVNSVKNNGPELVNAI